MIRDLFNFEPIEPVEEPTAAEINSAMRWVSGSRSQGRRIARDIRAITAAAGTPAKQYVARREAWIRIATSKSAGGPVVSLQAHRRKRLQARAPEPRQDDGEGNAA